MSDFDITDNLIDYDRYQPDFYGVVIGKVTNNKDPEKLGRIKVKFSFLSDKDESHWARVVTPMAGKDRGIFFLPEIDDEVAVVFAQGHRDEPYVIGTLWNKNNLPPLDNSDGKNNQRLIKSRSGHQIILDDTEGEEQIIIQDKTEKNQILINSKENTMGITVEKDLTITTKGKIILNSTGDDVSIECKNLVIKTEQNYQLEAGQDCTIAANSYAVEAQSGLDIKCSSGVKINDDSLEVM